MFTKILKDNHCKSLWELYQLQNVFCCILHIIIRIFHELDETGIYGIKG